MQPYLMLETCPPATTQLTNAKLALHSMTPVVLLLPGMLAETYTGYRVQPEIKLTGQFH